MNGTRLVLLLVLAMQGLGALGWSRPARGGEVALSAAVADLKARPLSKIPAGTVIGDGPPKHWSHLVMISKPRLAVGDLDAVSESAAQTSGIFQFTVLANVKEAPDTEGKTSYHLERVAIGGALDTQGKKIIARGEQTFGRSLGFLERKVFDKGEGLISTDFQQVGRTRTMLVFDAEAYILFRGKHRRMVIRHAIIVTPENGRLTTFVWLLGSNGKGGYAVAEAAVQLLPASFHEDRMMSVDGDKFFLGIPGSDAIALARIPQGTPVRYTDELKALAALKTFDVTSIVNLEKVLQTRYAPLATRQDARPLKR